MNRPSEVLGIDVGKDFLVIYDTASKRHLKIANTVSAIHMSQEKYHWTKATHQVGLESTGDYSLLAMKELLSLGFTVRLLNPILTKAGIQRTVRGTKTDASDSKLIAELTLKGEGQIVTEQSLEIGKKTIVRTERKLAHIAGDLKRLLKALGQKKAAETDVSEVTAVLEGLLKETLTAEEKLWEIAADPGNRNHLGRQEEIIDSHVGCGTKLSMIISEEAGDIKRFKSARQLVAYAGIDPKVIQSGSMDIRGRMTKRGNSNLRNALYMAANIARIHDPELKAYFDKKRQDGKHFTVAICAVARKMCHRIHATVTEDRLYEKREAQVVKEHPLSTETAT